VVLLRLNARPANVERGTLHGEHAARKQAKVALSIGFLVPKINKNNPRHTVHANNQPTMKSPTMVETHKAVLVRFRLDLLKAADEDKFHRCGMPSLFVLQCNLIPRIDDTCQFLAEHSTATEDFDFAL
jgi:hypothetical protein